MAEEDSPGRRVAVDGGSVKTTRPPRRVLVARFWIALMRTELAEGRK